MIVLVIICVILGITCLLLTVQNSEYRSTLKSKKKYDEMTELMNGERRLIKEDRVNINSTIRAYKNDVYNLTTSLKEAENKYISYNRILRDKNDYLEVLTKKYIKNRIDHLQAFNNQKAPPTKVLYDIQDLINEKKRRNMSVEDFVKKIDVILDEFSETFK